mmetsp:Transcript_65405/g.136276  ORF Transcript_65405/g.136276 Transcript_65405/m.136276 type:complete len:272 (+) Transcript_65405:382-1197(+)
MVCDGNGVAFVASFTSPSAVVAVALSLNNDVLVRRSKVTPLPETCGGVLMMKFSSTHKLLVVTCGKDPASTLGIQVDRSDPEEFILTPQDLSLIDGPDGVMPRGLALYDDPADSYALVGLSEGTVVKLTLPNLKPIDRKDVDAKRIAMFSIGNNGNTLLMFSPFPWRRLLLMNLDVALPRASVTTIALDQDLEFMVDTYVEPTTTTAYAVGNSQRQLPVMMQFDTSAPSNKWGLILAGICNSDGPRNQGSWCHWAPYGPYARRGGCVRPAP